MADKARLRKGMEQNARYQSGQRRDFKAALTARPPAVIAEIKKASPSKGLLCEDFNPGVQARAYFSGGAAALSVLTDKDFCQGSLSDLKMARATAMLPVLRKDFTIDELDVLEAAGAGADAILLIAAILTRAQLEELRTQAVLRRRHWWKPTKRNSTGWKGDPGRNNETCARLKSLKFGRLAARMFKRRSRR